MTSKRDSIIRLILITVFTIVIIGGGIGGFFFWKKVKCGEVKNPSNGNVQVINKSEEDSDDIDGENGNNGGKDSAENDKEDKEEQLIDGYINDPLAFLYCKVSEGEYAVCGFKSENAVRHAKIILPVVTGAGEKVVGVKAEAFSVDGYKLNSKIKEVIIPASYKFVEENAFRGSNVNALHIGIVVMDSRADISRPTTEGELIIEKYAFADCKNLKKIEFYKSVKRVEDNALYGANGLSEIYVESKYALNGLNETVFGSKTSENIVVYVEDSIDNKCNVTLNSKFVDAGEAESPFGIRMTKYVGKGKVYNLTIDTDGGTYLGEVKSFTKYDDIIIKGVCEKEHYTFAGYQLPDGKIIYEEELPYTIEAGILDEDTTITALYIPIIYEIKFDLDGGEQDFRNIQAVSARSGDIKLHDIKKTGYLFSGWYLDPLFVKKVETVSINDLVEDNTLGRKIVKVYAKFEKLFVVDIVE